MSLFRKQAVDQSYNRLWGSVVVSQPLSYKLLSWTIFSLVAIAILFLLFSEFHRKERVRGYLVPTQGVLKSYAPERAYVTKVMVEEGQHLDAGEPMFMLALKRTLTSGQDASKLSIDELNRQITLLEKQQQQEAQLATSQADELNARMADLKEQKLQIGVQITHVSERIKLVKTRVDNYAELSQQGLMDQYSREQQQELMLSLKQEKGELGALAAQVNQQLGAIQVQLARLPLELEKTTQALALQISERKQSLLQLQSQYRIQIKAQKAGRVTAIQVKEGQLVNPQQLMASVLPETASLYAELLIPTRAFGFVKAGQQTRLKFDAFPYQKFGVMQAELYETSQHILLPDEVQLPIKLQEPMYKVKVSLPKQTITAYGEQMPLQAGMLLEADVLLDKRSIAEWLLEPLYSLRGN